MALYPSRMATDTSWIRQEIAGLIGSAMERSDLTMHELAERSGISLPSLANKLVGTEDFSVEELFGIADALQVLPSTLVPRPASRVGA